MKYVNWIKLLSVLLCAVMLLAACAPGGDDPVDAETSDAITNADTEADTEAEDTAEPKLPLIEAVDPKFENFFTKSPAGLYQTLGAATRLDGDVVATNSDHSIMAIRTAKIDHLNKVTETVTVYNFELKKAVLTLENTYEYGDYDWFDFSDPYYYDDALRFPDHLMKVEIEEEYLGNGDSFYYVHVRRAEITPMDKDVYKENEGNSHSVSITHEFYDVAGTKIASANGVDVENWVEGYYEEPIYGYFANTKATFDCETQELISAVNADTGVARYEYDAETDKYGYYLDARDGMYMPYLQVYNKADNTSVLRYYYDTEKYEHTAGVMANGDVLIQYYTLVDPDSGLPYDVAITAPGASMEIYVKMDTVLLDVTTGETTPVELDYLLAEMVTGEEFEEEYQLDRMGITLTDKAVNLAFAMKIENGRIDINANRFDFLVLNHDGSVLYELERLIPEQKIDPNSGYLPAWGVTLLPNGDYLVNLENLVSKLAIVKADGTVRCYLNDNMKIVGNHIVTDEGVYDYDLNCLYKFEENKLKLAFTTVEKIVVTRDVEKPKAGEPSVLYYDLFEQDGVFMVNQIFKDQMIDLENMQKEGEYFIVQDLELGKYHLYNVALEHILTTENEMNVWACEDQYLVRTQLFDGIDTIDLLYMIG